MRVTLSSGSNYNDFLRLAVEAGFDWVYYETSNRVRLSVIPSSKCDNQVSPISLSLLLQHYQLSIKNDAFLSYFILKIISLYDSSNSCYS